MKIEKFEYHVFAGPTKDALFLACSYKNKEDAIQGAKNLSAEKIRSMKYIQVIYNAEHEGKWIDEIVWSNWEGNKI